uniref:G-protein coupled receptors family 1 profile domain-containing protein n=1 Tax=Denticeps clupeoides TaxID=299321 RepID=A0AAY4DFC3_9TELE
MDNSSDLQGNCSGQNSGVVAQVLVPILDTAILVTGILGHSLVIFILRRKRRRATAQGTDTLLLSLSAADLILLACLPFHTVAIATGHWPFGSVMCKFMGFMGAVCTSACAFTLAALATARYLIVVQPTRAYRWRKDARLTLATAALWLPGLILAAPQFAWRTLESGSVLQRETHKDLVCFNFLSHKDQLAYGVCHFLLAFVLPLLVILLAYGRIYCFLKETRQSREPGQAADRLERYQNKVTQTSALLVLAFALCWLPSYAFMFTQLASAATIMGTSPRYGGFATFARVMATISPVANPILYCFMSQKFRRQLSEMGRKSYCCLQCAFGDYPFLHLFCSAFLLFV